MASKRHWSVFIALLLILGLFLVACVRPLPGDEEAAPEATPAEDGSISQPEPYPAPPEVEDSETTAEGYPAGESYPAGEEDEAVGADLLQPDQEEGTEAYPGTEGEAAEGEHTEGEAAEGEHTEGETAEGEHTEGETAEGEHTEGEAAEGEHTEGEAAEGKHTEGEAAEGEHTEGEAAEGEQTEGEAVEGETVEDAAVETGRTHTVAAGETLFRIGMQYGMSWVALAQANDITNPNSLSVGQVLVIPDVETLEAAESESEETETETPAAAEESETPAEGELLTVYIGPELKDCVGVGPQTCMQVKMSPDDDYIFFYDQIEGFEYEPGYEYELLVLVEPVENPPADASTLKYTLVEEGSKTPVSAEEVEAGDAETEEVASEETTYIVQFGDTLHSISYRYGVSMMEIARENELVSFDQIYTGQELIIPQVAAEEEAEAETTASEGVEVTHVVQEGETIFTIAFQYGLAWTKLVEANKIESPYTLEIGQTLVVPSEE